jgi:hypothetical protein
MKACEGQQQVLSDTQLYPRQSVNGLRINPTERVGTPRYIYRFRGLGSALLSRAAGIHTPGRVRDFTVGVSVAFCNTAAAVRRACLHIKRLYFAHTLCVCRLILTINCDYLPKQN